MILKRFGSVLAIGLFVAAVGYNVRFLFTPRTPVPVIDCPAVVDLGDRDLGEIAVKRLTITNTGEAELLISKVRSSCSCSGLELDGGDQALSFTEVSIAPGEAKKFCVKLQGRYKLTPAREVDPSGTLRAVSFRLRHTTLAGEMREPPGGQVTVPVQVKPKPTKLDTDALSSLDNI